MNLRLCQAVPTNSSAEFDATTATPDTCANVNHNPDTATRPVRAAAVPHALSHLPPPHRTYTRAPANTLHIHPATHAGPCRRTRPCLPGRPVGACAPAVAHPAHVVRPSLWTVRTSAFTHTPAARPPGVPRAAPAPAALPKALESRRACTSSTLLPAKPLKSVSALRLRVRH